MKHKRTALVVGATGLIGGLCVQGLLDSPQYETVVTFGRSHLELKHSKLSQLIGTIDDMPAVLGECHVDDVFCCIGTTIKKARSKAAFKQVDFNYPVDVARLMKDLDAEHFCVVSALGANPSSSVFYNQIKGELEKALQAMGYSYLTIMRPSLLVGDRNEFRFGEVLSAKVAKVLGLLFIGSLKEVKPVQASQVARVMVKEGEEIAEGLRVPGIRIISSREIQDG